jgi:Ca2+-binding EF-hand superfamily protein
MSLSMESSIGDAEGFQGAFALMDVRGFGKIGLEAIFDFVSACPNPPSIEDVTRLYNEFDEDGSGDIDSGEFVGFCDELERVTGYSAKELVTFFEKKQYEHLFSLVDDDGGGTISSMELKTLVEALHSMLDLKKTASDVRLIMKEYDKEELDFEDFFSVMKKLMGHKSILLVVRAFEQAQRQRKATMSSAMRVFEAPQNTEPIAVRPHARSMYHAPQPCNSCKSKDKELELLRKQVAELEAQVAAQSARAVPESRPVESIEPRMRLAMRSVDLAIGLQSQFPPVKPCALHHQSNTRFLALVNASASIDPSEMQAYAKRLADLADTTHKAQRQIAAVLDGPCGAIHRALDERAEFLSALGQRKDGREQAAMALAVGASQKAQVHLGAEAVAWTVEAAVEARKALANWAAALVPFSTNQRKFMRFVVEAEAATQQLLDLAVLVQWYGSEEPSELEVVMDRLNTGAPAEVTEEQHARFTIELASDRRTTSVAQRGTLIGALKETTYALQGLSQSLSSTTKRDRGCGTAPLESILPAEPIPAIMPRPRHAPQAIPEHGMLSRPPRVRDVYTVKDTRSPVVDKMLQRYLASGVRVPENFTRYYTTDVRDATRHLFVFGSRKIEIFVVEGALAVKVGGGYMYFEEFCELYTDMEVSRLNRNVCRSTSPNNLAREASASSPSLRSASLRSQQAAPLPPQASATTAPRALFSSRRGGSVESQLHLDAASPPRNTRTGSPSPQRTL